MLVGRRAEHPCANHEHIKRVIHPQIQPPHQGRVKFDRQEKLGLSASALFQLLGRKPTVRSARGPIGGLGPLHARGPAETKVSAAASPRFYKSQHLDQPARACPRDRVGDAKPEQPAGEIPSQDVVAEEQDWVLERQPQQDLQA
jgi:hypothetical protein